MPKPRSTDEGWSWLALGAVIVVYAAFRFTGADTETYDNWLTVVGGSAVGLGLIAVALGMGVLATMTTMGLVLTVVAAGLIDIGEGDEWAVQWAAVCFALLFFLVMLPLAAYFQRQGVAPDDDEAKRKQLRAENADKADEFCRSLSKRLSRLVLLLALLSVVFATGAWATCAEQSGWDALARAFGASTGACEQSD